MGKQQDLSFVKGGTITSSNSGLLSSDGHEPSLMYRYFSLLKQFLKKRHRLLGVVALLLLSFMGIWITTRSRSRVTQIDSNVSHLLHEVAETSGMRGLRSRVRLFEWGPGSEREVKRHRIKTLHVIFYDGTSDDAFVIEEAMKRVATQFYKRNILHVKVRKEFMRDFQFFLPEDPELYIPFSTIVEADRGFRKYRHPQNQFSSIVIQPDEHNNKVAPLQTALTAFEEDYFSGELADKTWLRSEKAYKNDEQDGSNVKQLVGLEFQSSVIKPRIDTLVFFYAPWCGHCKRFEKYFTELADSFSSVPTLKFFKIDVTKNDVGHPAIVIHRVPYVRLFKMHDKTNPVLFEHAHSSLPEYGRKFLMENIVVDGAVIEL